MRRYVPGVKMSGCTSYIYSWVEIIIDAERTPGYSVYTIKNLGVRVGNELKVISKQPFCLIVIEIDK